MQIKKDEVKNSLLLSARQEFLNKGFKKASVRSIVKNAHTTIGNFYNYFESKEMIFAELVDKAYTDLVDFINTHEGDEMTQDAIINMDTAAIKAAADNMLAGLVPKFNKDFLLLVEYAEDTKYANAKEEIIDFIAEHFMEHIDMYAPNYAYPQMSRIVSSQMIHGIADIIKYIEDLETRHKLIVEQILFTSLGVMGILQGEHND